MASPAAEQYGNAAAERSAQSTTDKTLLFIGIGAAICAVLIALSQGKIPFFTGIGGDP